MKNFRFKISLTLKNFQMLFNKLFLFLLEIIMIKLNQNFNEKFRMKSNKCKKKKSFN